MPVPDFFFVDESYKLDDHNGRETLVNDRSELLEPGDVQAPERQEPSSTLAAPHDSVPVRVNCPTELRASLIVTNFQLPWLRTPSPSRLKRRRMNDGQIRRILSQIDGPTLIFCRSPEQSPDRVTQ